VNPIIALGSNDLNIICFVSKCKATWGRSIDVVNRHVYDTRCCDFGD